jgi:hypothetical protein
VNLSSYDGLKYCMIPPLRIGTFFKAEITRLRTARHKVNTRGIFIF